MTILYSSKHLCTGKYIRNIHAHAFQCCIIVLLMKSIFEINVSPDCCLFLGEHIDYCGYSVLPMAIEQDVVIAVAATESQDILLSNVKSDVYR